MNVVRLRWRKCDFGCVEIDTKPLANVRNPIDRTAVIEFIRTLNSTENSIKNWNDEKKEKKENWRLKWIWKRKRVRDRNAITRKYFSMIHYSEFTGTEIHNEILSINKLILWILYHFSSHKHTNTRQSKKEKNPIRLAAKCVCDKNFDENV